MDGGGIPAIQPCDQPDILPIHHRAHYVRRLTKPNHHRRDLGEVRKSVGCVREETPYGKLINERPRVKAWWEDIFPPALKKVAAGLTLDTPRYCFSFRVLTKDKERVMGRKDETLGTPSDVDGGGIPAIQTRDQPDILPIHHRAIMYGGSPNQTIIDETSAKLGKVLDVYEKRLRSNKYLAGDFYSLADLHHLSYIYYLMKTPYGKLINERPRVRAWWEDISSRPAFKKVAADLTLGDKN
ncbi:Glutathione S-transferase F13 [Hibiscus syriacus]|uniref:glutathione transferase n=1 Tax=Hibiscus syriacus TaxID=106335 RepID=A0A6A2WG27_HIBSY|nr:Glutathione S-transferase F13 [Hibiscus syriacus]